MTRPTVLPFRLRRAAEVMEGFNPISEAEAALLEFQFKMELFSREISFTAYSPESSGTEFGGWRWEGLGFLIVWLNDGP